MTVTQRRLALFGVLVLGAVVRFYGIDFGLPGKFRPDEEYMASGAIAIASGKLDANPYNWPSFYKYLNGFNIYLTEQLGEIFNWFGGKPFRSYSNNLGGSPNYLLGRMMTAVWGVLCILAVYLLGKELRGYRVGLISAFLLSLNFLHVRDSHFFSVDVPMTVLATLAVTQMVRLVEKGRVRNYLLSGLFIGLSISAKYTAAALLAPLVVSHIVSITTRKVSIFSLKEIGKLSVGFIGSILFFFLTSPFFFINQGWNTQPFQLMLEFAKKGLSTVAGEHGIEWVLRFCRISLGYPMTVLLIFATLFIFWRIGGRERKDERFLIPISFILGVLFCYFRAKWVPIRYVVLLLPFFIVMIAALIDSLLKVIPTTRLRALSLVLLLSLALGSHLERVVRLNGLFTKYDTRELAYHWIDRNIPEGSRILYYGPSYGKPVKSRKYQYLHRSHCPKLVDCIDWVVMDIHPISQFSRGYIGILAPFKGQVPIVEFSPFSPATSEEAVFDRSDSFYIPIENLEAVERPGPTIRVYRVS